MDIQYNKRELETTLKDVYQFIRTPISVFDKNYKFVASYPAEGIMTTYCTLVRKTEKGAEGCRRSDVNGGLKCQSVNGQVSYVCHARLLETVTPIRF